MPKKPSCLALLFLMTAACNPIYYSSPTLNTPQHTGSGDFHLGLSGSAIQVEVQGSYAATDHVGLMASHNYVSIGSNRDDYDDGVGHGSMFDGGIGYYRVLEDGARFAVYGIYGTGRLSNTFDGTSGGDGRIDADIHRFAVQPMMGIQRGPVEWIVALRYGLLAYDDIEGDLVYDGEDQIEYLRQNSRQFVSEPSITFRFGPERLRFQIQGGINFNMTEFDFWQRRSHLTFGVVFRNIRSKK